MISSKPWMVGAFALVLVTGVAVIFVGRAPRLDAVRQVLPKVPVVEYSNPLSGLRLNYLIGTDAPGDGADGVLTEVGYTAGGPVQHGVSAKYANLFDEQNTGRYGPYLHESDTAKQYSEGQIDPRGPGWQLNLDQQFVRARSLDFEYVELDNPDAYSVDDVVGAINLAAKRGLKVLAKNSLLMATDPLPVVAHRSVVGVIVERGAGSPPQYDTLRIRAGKPDLPVWFVGFDLERRRGIGWSWAQRAAKMAQGKNEMRVSYSPRGEYTSSEVVK